MNTFVLAKEKELGTLISALASILDGVQQPGSNLNEAAADEAESASARRRLTT